MKVLSLFDGISCGRLALERAGITVDRYVAYEIESNAIKDSMQLQVDFLAKTYLLTKKIERGLREHVAVCFGIW